MGPSARRAAPGEIGCEGRPFLPGTDAGHHHGPDRERADETLGEVASRNIMSFSFAGRPGFSAVGRNPGSVPGRSTPLTFAVL